MGSSGWELEGTTRREGLPRSVKEMVKTPEASEPKETKFRRTVDAKPIILKRLAGEGSKLQLGKKAYKVRKKVPQLPKRGKDGRTRQMSPLEGEF